MTRYDTLTQMLDAAAETQGEIGFIDGANDERRLGYRLLRRAAERMLAVLQARGASAGVVDGTGPNAWERRATSRRRLR